MAVLQTHHQSNALVFFRVLLKNRRNMRRGRSIIGNTKLPVCIELIYHRIDAKPQPFFIDVIDGKNYGNERFMRKTFYIRANIFLVRLFVPGDPRLIIFPLLLFSPVYFYQLQGAAPAGFPPDLGYSCDDLFEKVFHLERYVSISVSIFGAAILMSCLSRTFFAAAA